MDGRSRFALGTLATTFVFLMVAAAAAVGEQIYKIDGRDSFQVGSRELRGDIVYSGNETLTIRRDGKARRYSARVDYVRRDQGAVSRARAAFVSVIKDSGEQRDELNHDPDYLTVLNQPFSAQLDAATLHDLERLHGRVPFDFPSPMTGAPLHGYLEHATDAFLAGVRVVGIKFAADGPLHGKLPDHPGMTMRGTIRMTGTAYYASTSALVMSLDATMTISGTVAESGSREPVTIVYRRSLRPPTPAEEREARATTH